MMMKINRNELNKAYKMNDLLFNRSSPILRVNNFQLKHMFFKIMWSHTKIKVNANLYENGVFLEKKSS